MRKNVLALVVFLVLSCFGFAQNSVIEPELQTILNQKTDDYIDINIVLKSQMPAEELFSLSFRGDSKEDRRELVISELKKFAEQSQKDVIDFIQAEAKNNKVIDIKQHWLVNNINCKAKHDVIYQLASHPDIEIIGYDKEEIIDSSNDSQEYSATRDSQNVSQHITHINADKAWKLGYTGKGVVVAIIDTGVNYDHDDLKDHLWKDGSNTYPGYNFLNPGTAPSDDKGHGTHCAGVVGGDGTSGTATGIAPDATLMCLKVNSASVNAQLSTIVTAVEYAVDKGADVISISKNGWANNDAHITFRNLFNNTLEAGIITVVSAGNYRANLNTNLPVPGNVMAPANCPPPYLHPDQTLTGGLSGVMCIGSVGYDNQIAAFSSQGPVTWEGVSGYNDYPYNNGASMGLIRPDVVAPGENIFTLSNTENNGLVETMGTSISTPITAGVIALMLEKNPDLTPAEICRILENTATKLTERKSNDYGSGCVNALAAVQNTEFNTSNAAVNLYSFDETINAKQNTNFSITIINNGKGTGSGNVTISTTNGNISFTNTTASYSGLAAGQTTTLNFTANVNTNATDQETATFTLNIDGISKDVEVIISNELVPPTNITSNVQGTNIALSWDEANNATSYNIYRDGTYLANTTSTSYTDEGLNYGTLYTYNITTKRNSLESEKSIDVRVQTLDNPEAPSPTNVAATNNGSSVNLTWTNSTGSLSSNVYKMNSGIETKIASNVNGTSYTDNTALGTGIYKYGVSNVHAKNETIYEEYFENSGEGWYRYYSNNNFKTNWSFAKSATFGDFDAYMGNMSAFISSTANNENYLSYLVSPQFDLREYSGSSIKLSFYYITPSWAGDINTLKVKISTSSNQGPWTELWSSNKKDISTWTKAEIDLSAYTNSTFYIAFENTIGAGYCTGVDNVNISVEGEKESRIEWSEDIYNNINVFVQDGDWSNTSNWGAKRLPNESEQVVIDANATINSGSYTLNALTINEGNSLTINNGVKLTVTGYFTNTNPDAFIINDGAQVIQNNDDVAATFNMNISNPSEWSAENIEGWQFISSPVKGAEISGFVPEYSDYDLYVYDGSNNLEWINHKDENVDNWTTFQQGVGYMASYEIETTATFKGILNHENSYTFNLSYDNTKDLANLHLLGNPFSFDIDWNDLVKTNIVDGFAVVNENGSYDYHSLGTIKVGDGIFVKTIGDNPSISYGLSKGQRDREVDVESINLVATSSIGSDNVIISLSGSENEGFTKLQNFNEAIANIFVTKNDVRYAIAKFDKDVTTIDVAFEAKEMGNYTIAAQPQGKFETLTLVDRFTGIETDLLVENYNFTATSKDDLNRFIVKLEVNSQEPTVNGNFAYVSGEELIIKAEGIVQIFDLMGRVVYSNEVTSDNNRINVGDFNNAVYIIRCVNDESVKTQKVVIN